MAEFKVYRNRVYLKRPPIERLREKFIADAVTGCWNWTGKLMWHGYGRMEVDGMQMYAHRASWYIHHGNIRDGLFVCHHCDNKKCVNPEHLYLGTPQQNMDDAVARNRFPLGSARRNSKLTEHQVIEIKLEIKNGVSDAELARRFLVNTETVRGIRIGHTWKWVVSP